MAQAERIISCKRGDRRSPLKKCRYPINHAIQNAGGDAVDDDRAGDGEHLCTDTKDEAFGFELDGRGGDGVGKAGDGHQRACAGVFGDVIVKTQTRQQGREGYQRHGGGCGGLLFVQVKPGIEVDKPLTKSADRSADQKGEDAVFQNGRLGR